MKPALVRIDNKLIHGQVVTGWVKKLYIKNIIVVDDQSVKDDFMKQILIMAKPQGTKLQVMSTIGIARRFKDNVLKFDLPTLIIFKDVKAAYKAYQNGFVYDSMQVGCIGGGEGRINVSGPVCINKEDANMLTQLCQQGMDIYLQSTEVTKRVPWMEMKQKFFADL